MITIPITVKDTKDGNCEVKVQLLKKSKGSTSQEEKTASVIRNEVISSFNNNNNFNKSEEK